MKRILQTGNDVLDFNCYFEGKNEPPIFRKQFIDLRNKIFVPVDDLALMQLSKNPANEVILHHFVKDNRQNKFVFNQSPPLSLFQKVYAVTSSDLSVDSNNSYEIFNLSNILKARINAYRMQNEFGLLAILTLIWGSEQTFDFAFGNIEKGSVVAVSSQAIKDVSVFRKGLVHAIKIIEPENICWYGQVYDWVGEYYDVSKIVKMQTRTQLIRQKKVVAKYKWQKSLFAV